LDGKTFSSHLKYSFPQWLSTSAKINENLIIMSAERTMSGVYTRLSAIPYNSRYQTSLAVKEEVILAGSLSMIASVASSIAVASMLF